MLNIVTYSHNNYDVQYDFRNYSITQQESQLTVSERYNNTFIRSSMCLSTSSLKPSTQNKSNKQSMHVKLCNIKLLVSSAAAKNLVKNSMHNFIQLNQLCTVSDEFRFCWSCASTNNSMPLFLLEGSMIPDLLDSCT